MSKLGYRPAIDGLRSVAIIPVILFHLGASWLPGGFLGVDVFFVISGYLISSLICAELDEGSFSFSRFWTRRVRRIMPALLCMVVVTLLLSRYLVTPVSVASIARDGQAAAFSYANIWLSSKVGNYWGTAAQASPFLHAWSLSVEEQFYLVYPLLLAVVARIRLPRVLVLGALWLLSLAAFTLLFRKDPTFTFYMLPTRAWELLAGALTAALAPRLASAGPAALRLALPVAGLALIAFSFQHVDGEQGIDLWTVVPVAGTALVLLYSGDRNPVTWLLGLKPLVFIGKISYSLYLWHWVAITLAHLFELRSGEELPLSRVVIAIVVSSLVCHYAIERPVRAWRRGQWVAAAMLPVVGWLSYSAVRRASDPNVAGDLNPVVCYSAYYDGSPIKDMVVQVKRVNPNDPALGVWAGVIGEVPNPAWSEAYKNGGIPAGTRSYRARADVILIGDSHGCMWGKTVDEVSRELGLATAVFTFDGNVPFFPIPIEPRAAHGKGFSQDQFQEFSAALLKNIDDWHPRLLILASRWETKHRQDFRNIEALAQYCVRAGAKVLIISNPPILPWENESTAQSLVMRNFKPREATPQYIEAKQPERLEAANVHMKDLAERLPGATWLDVYGPLYKDGKVQVLQGADVLYVDDDHLSYQGTTLFKTELRERMSALTRR